MTIYDDMADVLANDIYDTTSGMAVTAYYSKAGRSLAGIPHAKQQMLGTSVPVIVSYGKEGDAGRPEGFGTVITLRVQATGDDGVADLEHGAQFYVDGTLWQVTDAAKSADGLEWIATCHKLIED